MWLMSKDNYTQVTKGVITCNDCGAFAGRIQDIIHYNSCRSGESKRWERYYNEGYEQDVKDGFYDKEDKKK